GSHGTQSTDRRTDPDQAKDSRESPRRKSRERRDRTQEAVRRGHSCPRKVSRIENAGASRPFCLCFGTECRPFHSAHLAGESVTAAAFTVPYTASTVSRTRSACQPAPLLGIRIVPSARRENHPQPACRTRHLRSHARGRRQITLLS